jgi:endonuclease III
MVDIGQMLGLLEGLYGHLPSPPRDPFGFYVWEVLSHHATPRQTDAALQALKRLRALTPDAMHRAPPREIQSAVRLAGSYLDARLQALDAGASLFRRSSDLTFGLPKTLRKARPALSHFPNLGSSGVRRMLLFAGDYPVFPIDASIERLFLRLGVADRSSPPRRFHRRLRRTIVSGLPRSCDAYRRAFLYFSHHGVMTCTERPRCAICPLLPECPEGQRRRAAANAPHGKRA